MKACPLLVIVCLFPDGWLFHISGRRLRKLVYLLWGCLYMLKNVEDWLGRNIMIQVLHDASSFPLKSMPAIFFKLIVTSICLNSEQHLLKYFSDGRGQKKGNFLPPSGLNDFKQCNIFVFSLFISHLQPFLPHISLYRLFLNWHYLGVMIDWDNAEEVWVPFWNIHLDLRYIMWKKVHWFEHGIFHIKG